MNYSFRKDNDWLFICATFLLTGFGLLMVYSSSYVWGLNIMDDPYYFIKRQVVWFILSAFAFLFVMHIPYRFYQKITPIILIVSIFLLVAIFIPGLGWENKGAQRWIRIASITIQPSEIVKIGIAIYLANVYSKKQAYINRFIIGVMPPLAVVAIVFSLVLLQPDLGTALSILMVALLIVFFSGAKWRHLIGLGIAGLGVAFMMAIAAPYRMERLTGFKDPFADQFDTGLQLVQSYIAIAHGGVFGTGLGQSVQKLLYLPEPHTDFILAIIAEELGIFGVLLVLGLHGIILFRGVMIGTRCKNAFGSLLAFGLSFQIAIQVLLNIGAVTGLLPITGVPLPLVSNGGTSLLITFISLGILANISRSNIRSKRLQEEKEGEQLSVS